MRTISIGTINLSNSLPFVRQRQKDQSRRRVKISEPDTNVVSTSIAMATKHKRKQNTPPKLNKGIFQEESHADKQEILSPNG